MDFKLQIDLKVRSVPEDQNRTETMSEKSKISFEFGFIRYVLKFDVRLVDLGSYKSVWFREGDSFWRTIYIVVFGLWTPIERPDEWSGEIPIGSVKTRSVRENSIAISPSVCKRVCVACPLQIVSKFAITFYRGKFHTVVDDLKILQVRNTHLVDRAEKIAFSDHCVVRSEPTMAEIAVNF